MVILASAVVITLSNTGVINKANEAVNEVNQKEVEQLATLVWAEEFMNGKRGEELKASVVTKLSDYADKYSIEVTDTGVTIAEKGTIVAGLFATGTNELIYSWADLIEDEVIIVENGVVYTPYEAEGEPNLSSNILEGDLVLPHDGSIKYIGGKSAWNDYNGKDGFTECEKLTSVKIPASVERINPEAFYECQSLSKIEFEQGSKLTFIGERALTGLAYNKKLEVIYPGTMS